MHEINKIKLIHDIRNVFTVDDNTINNFIEQIVDTEIKNNIDRFFRGYNAENDFHLLYSAIPWVKLIHELGQNQLPALSKQTYQVPDFTIFFETCKKSNFSILLEVKSVKGDKQSLELMSKQMQACLDYAKISGQTLLYAIYWEKYQLWTFNAIENFEQKSKKHKLKFSDAIKNDLSVIVGDVTFSIAQPIYRKTICDKSVEDDTKPIHEEFGTILCDSMSIDNLNYFEISDFESAIIDASINMKIIYKKLEGDKTTITEISEGNYLLKLSKLILLHGAMFDLKLKEDFADMSRRTIIEFFKKLDIQKSYSIPYNTTKTSDLLYKEAFEGSWVFTKYIESKEFLEGQASIEKN